MKSHKKLWTALSSVFGGLTAIMLAGTFVANSFATSLNAFFACDTYKIVKGNSDADTDYYPDEWEGYNEWFERYEQDLCERVEGEGAVLLKNENKALPLKEGASVSFFSHSSVDLVYSGTGSGSVDTSTAPTLRKAFESRGFHVNGKLWTFYNTGAGSKYTRSVPALSSCTAVGDYKVNEVPWSVYTNEVKDSIASYGDAAIFVLARTGGEGGDAARTTAVNEGNNGDYLTLTTQEKEVLEQLKEYKDKGTIKKIIVLVNSSNAVQCNFLDDKAYGIDAALWIAGPGAYGTNAIADIFAGNVNPSGKLVDTFLKDNFSNPSLYNFGDCTYANAAAVGLKDTNDASETNVNYVVYQEGIYVGYKYYETRYADQVMGVANVGDYSYDDCVYRTFGFGLSYTDFTYSDYKLSETSDAVTISVKVTNSGNVAGKNTVELYLQKPYTDYDKENGIEKSAVELCGFAKTKKLDAGKSETVKITVDKKQMASYDANNAKTYILDAGDYYFAVGSDAHDAVNNILTAQKYTDKGNANLVGKVTQNKLDTEKYSVSSVTGEKITNQFDEADINKYDGISEKVTYLSRSDWEGTFPKATIQLTATEQLAKDTLDEFTPEEGYEMPSYGKQNGLTLAMMMGKTYDDPAWNDLLDQMGFDEQKNLIEQGFHNTKAIGSIGKPATMEENGPQGITKSFMGAGSSGMAYPAETIMAATWNKDIMREIGECIGVQGLKAGVNGVYGPAANIHRNAYCGRNYEYFSEDAYISGAMMTPEIEGIQSKGVYVFMKHFALNDQETHRAGVMTWANEQTIREAYLAAYETAVTQAHAKGAMTVMNRIGAIWGGAHAGLLTNVFRGEWGFDGIVITDYSSNSNYTSHVNGLQGGSDIWDGINVSATNTKPLSEYKDNAYVCQLMRQATHRILFVQANSSAMNGVASDDQIIPILTWWQSTLIAVDVVLGVLTAGCVTMLILDRKRK